MLSLHKLLVTDAALISWDDVSLNKSAKEKNVDLLDQFRLLGTSL